MAIIRAICQQCNGEGMLLDNDECFYCSGTGFDSSAEALEDPVIYNPARTSQFALLNRAVELIESQFRRNKNGKQ